jgi:hypothetical protein
MSKNYFKYELQRGGGSLFTPRDLTWFERLAYRLKCYKVIKMDEEYWMAHPVDNSKKTIVSLKIRY